MQWHRPCYARLACACTQQTAMCLLSSQFVCPYMRGQWIIKCSRFFCFGHCHSWKDRRISKSPVGDSQKCDSGVKEWLSCLAWCNIIYNTAVTCSLNGLEVSAEVDDRMWRLERCQASMLRCNRPLMILTQHTVASG